MNFAPFYIFLHILGREGYKEVFFLKIGDIVGRKSYGCDIFFRIVAVRGDKVILQGLSYRIEADASSDDLISIDSQKIVQHNRDIEQRVSQIFTRIEREESARGFRNMRQSSFKKMPTVLHLDGDENYLNKCSDQYKKLGIPVIGRYIEEAMQPRRIKTLLETYHPDMVVITGHDSVLKGTKDRQDIRSYKNSSYFVESVKEARKYESNYDNLVIFAGACQSCYEAIIEAGANYASSPERVLIDWLR